MKTLKTFFYFNIIDKRKNKKEHFCSSGSSGETRGYTTSNLITTEGLMTWSSEVFRILSSHEWNEKVTKTENLRKCFVWYFGVWRKREKVCVLCSQLFAILHSHTQLTNHHTEVIQSYHIQTIILLSHQNQSNLETYVSKIVWFWYDFGVMVWKWYDWMIVVWRFERCVCEWRIAKSCKGSTYTFSRFLQTPKYHTKHFLKFSVFATFSYQEMTWQYPEDLWRPAH